MPLNAPSRPGPSIGRIVRWILLSLVTLLVLLIVVARWNLRRKVNADLAGIRAAGQPLTLSELGARYQDLGGKIDVSKDFEAAFARATAVAHKMVSNGIPGSTLKVEDLPVLGRAPKIQPGQPLSGQLAEAVARALHELEPSIHELHEVLGRTNETVRYPIDLSQGFSTLLPHLAPLKTLAQWNELRCVRGLDRDDVDGANAAVIDTLRLSRTLEAEPFLISQLVRFAMIRIAVDSVTRVLDRGPLSRDQAVLLRTELERARPDRAVFVAMTGERCLGLDFMWFKHMNPAELDGMNGQSTSFGSGALMLAYRMTGLADRDVRFYLNALDSAVSAATNRVPERLALMNDPNRFDPHSRGPLYLFSSLLLPSLTKSFQKEADCLTAVAATDAALAVEEWRAGHGGRLPETLAELVPEFVPAVPVDPATGKPLTLVPGARGYAIHGSGPLITVTR